jgi:hypothetical protein
LGLDLVNPGWRRAQIYRCAVSRLRTSISVSIVIAIGLIVLLGYFIDVPVLVNLREIFLQWAVILAAIALIVGVLNLLNVHWKKINANQPGSLYSTILILALLATAIAVAVFRPTGSWSMWIFNYIQVPIESSLMALLAVILAYASARMLSRRLNLFSIVFIVTALIVLLGTASLPFLDLPVLSEFRGWIERIPAVAGSRGILLGVALGTIATGLRVLMGADRPYGG